MKPILFALLSLVGSSGHAGAQPVVEGRVLLPSGAPVPGARVLLFDLADLRAPPLAATTDGSGHFTLPLASLAGVLPERFELGANYPNPFNPSTMIPYQLPHPMHLRLEVFNLLGQRVATLVDGEQQAGFHTARWDATDAAGEAVGAGVYLYRLSGDGVQATRSMLLIDGRAGTPSGGGGATGSGGEGAKEAGQTARVYGLTVSGPGLIPHVDPAFRVQAGMALLDVVVEAPGGAPRAKVASSDRILGDVDNTGSVDFFDALLVALYSRYPSIVVMPNSGDISLGDVSADGEVDLSDAWAIAAWLNDPSDPTLPAGIGEPAGPAASLSPDPSTVAFIDDGSWHRFTVQAGEPVTVVANPEGGPPRLEITARSGRGNYCPAEADDEVSRQDAQRLYLAGCAQGAATVELREESDGTVLRTYTFEVTGSPADLVVASVSVSDSTLTPGQSFTLSATVRNQGTGQSEATTLRYYRSTNRTISTRDTRIGTDAVSALAAAGTRVDSIRLTAPSAEGTWYYGACVVSVGGESAGNNCSAGVRVTVDSAAPTTGSPAGDRAALVALYKATDGPDWTDNTNWLSDRPLSEWYGVTTANGRVTSLTLTNTNLRGPIPVELAQLSELERLGLGFNELTGTIPTQLARLAKLRSLELADNQLTGTIPIELVRLSNLERLELYQNELTGTIPIELVQLAKLRSLELASNQLTGTIPPELGQLANLERLRLGGNQLTGTIPPELARLSELQSLSLGYNQLTGTIPTELAGLTKLRYLELGDNQLTGTIPIELGQLSNLERLELHQNQLTGTIPIELGQLANLTELWLSSNELTGTIPPELGQLTDLTRLNLAANALEGTIPPVLRQLTKLTQLQLNHNALTGTIPPELGQLANLTTLELYRTRVTGTIPPELGQLAKLERLILQHNRLTGAIPPELARLANLKQLDIQTNNLTDAIPPELGQLTKLERLWLAGNQLAEAIPRELGQLANLEELLLGSNQLTGTIPPELGQLANLEELILGGNRLTGAIPPELGQLSKLSDLNLAANDGLSGPLPREFTALPLERFALVGTNVCVPRAVEFQEWLNEIEFLFPYEHCRDPQWDALAALYVGTDGPNWTNKANWASAAPLGEWYGVTIDAGGGVTGLNLENNNLSGTLSPALGGLANLKTLNLAGNAALSGPLPQTITALPLERLALQGSEVCTPPGAEFQSWLNGISGGTGVPHCIDTRLDYYALVELYSGTDGRNWTNKTNWARAAPLGEWYGVTTDSGGRVTGLLLADNNLQGPLPAGLGRLTHLSNLDVSGNRLEGEIPSELGQLANLGDLNLSGNQLEDEIPSELGQLANLGDLNLSGNRLKGEIPPELGRLTRLSNLNLSYNPLTGEIPPELGRLTNLETLEIWYTRLTGTIPRELGQLANLRVLELVDNFSLTGEIPPELGQLGNLERLRLINNDLNGEIPSELGQLTNLRNLNLARNQLEGEIPSGLAQLSNLGNLSLAGNQLTGGILSELGQLTELWNLDLSGNQLTGEIPSELGQLTELRDLLDLSGNQLTGEVPSEMGRLGSLEELRLRNNQLAGEIPPQLGQLGRLSNLDLSSNQLRGNLPPELGDLGHLRSLNLAYNGALSGTLPDALTRLTLESLSLNETLLCPPEDADFQAWLFGIPSSRIPNCARTDGSTAYLTQAAQSLEYPVPLVAGEAALLRVFVTAGRDVEAAMPPVRATFYLDGAEAHTAEIAAQATSIPWQVNEGSLSHSANALVPGSVVRPGLEMVVEIDPDQTLDPTLGVGARLPPTGRTALNVRSVPLFDLTLIPFLWEENPDRSVLTRTEGLSPESDLFRLTRDLLPVGDFHLTVHEPVWTSVDPTSDAVDQLFPETELIHAMEGASGYHMGIFRKQGAGGLLGIAHKPGSTSLSILDPNTIAHELGHNLSLEHAPGCGAGGPDPEYPYADGSVGVWGYDFLTETLVSAGTSDLMTYCDPQWISEYSFAKAMGYRSRSEAPRLAAKYASSGRGLLLWGGRNESGELFVEPAFVVSAPPVPPRLDGPYRLHGEDEDGDSLFSLPFGMPELGCGGQGGAFAFILPAEADWAGRLARIVLSGPEGVSILDGVEDPSAALLLDRDTGRVRGVLRDWPEADGKRPAGKRLAARALPEPGMEVLTSHGLPDSASWVR